jgi:2-polyprenyl-3-methyl-5-hydroxy-6-metoxy-1,4-benzoquinol methylase
VSETHYQPLHDIAAGGLATLGVMANHTWRTDPKRLGFTLARYKFVAKMLAGSRRVLEVGCADAWATSVVAREVEHVTAVDFDGTFLADAGRNHADNVLLRQHDMTTGPAFPPDRLPTTFDAAYALDVLEHVWPVNEGAFLGNIAISIGEHGTFICGMPSLESQSYASSISREGHVNCKTERGLADTLRRYWRCVYTFGMNDETLHTGFGPMCHYRLAICTGAKL